MRKRQKAREILNLLKDRDAGTNELIRLFGHRFSEYIRQARAIAEQNSEGHITCTWSIGTQYSYHLEADNGPD